MFASVAPREVLARLRRGVAKPQVKLLIGVSDPYRRGCMIDLFCRPGFPAPHRLPSQVLELWARPPVQDRRAAVPAAVLRGRTGARRCR